MKALIRGAIASLLLVLPASSLGGDCSTLAVTTSDDGVTATLTFDVTGSTPLSPHVLVVGQTEGPFSLTLGTAVLELGVTPPFFAVPLGVSDPLGNVSASFDAPVGLGDFFGQSVGITFVGGLDFCESNTAGFGF